MPPVTRIMRFMPPSMMKALRSHGLSLIAQESFVERFDRFVTHGLGTERTHDFGSSLDIAHATSVEHSRRRAQRRPDIRRGGWDSLETNP